MESGGKIDRRSLTIVSPDPVHFQNKKSPSLIGGWLFLNLIWVFTQNYHMQSFQDRHRDFPTYRHRH